MDVWIVLWTDWWMDLWMELWTELRMGFQCNAYGGRKGGGRVY